MKYLILFTAFLASSVAAETCRMQETCQMTSKRVVGEVVDLVKDLEVFTKSVHVLPVPGYEVVLVASNINTELVNTGVASGWKNGLIPIN
jgi:hypothetical protein